MDRFFYVCLYAGLTWWTWGWLYYLFAVPSAGLAVLQVLNLLIEAFADEEALTAQEMYSSALDGNLKGIRTLLAAGCPVDSALSSPVGLAAFAGGPFCLAGSTALHGACTDGHLDVLNELVRAGADINARRHAYPDSDSRTALHEACKEGHTACALRLVDTGAETDIKDAWGLTPRALAQQKGHKSLAKMLKAAGAA